MFNQNLKLSPDVFCAQTVLIWQTHPQFNSFREMMRPSPWSAPTCSLRDISESLRIRTIGAVPPGVLRGRRGQEFEFEFEFEFDRRTGRRSKHLYDVTTEQLGGDWTELLHVNVSVLKRLQAVLTIDSTTVRGRQTHTNVSKQLFCSVGWKLLTRRRVIERGSVFWSESD